ncbi:MAG: hypothetical protein KC422_25550 [Trueperaceae bacterium]|nr:hypothetical protein [Trueperaceae bacterium]
MTQFEYVVLQFIDKHPQCTEADILASFVKAPDRSLLKQALSDLKDQQFIDAQALKFASTRKSLWAYKSLPLSASILQV